MKAGTKISSTLICYLFISLFVYLFKATHNDTIMMGASVAGEKKIDGAQWQ